MFKKNNVLPDFFINAFYESKFRDSLFIIKASGAVIEDESARKNLLANIRDLTLRGIKVILIYGGGKAIDAALNERGIDVQKNQGRRITDADTMRVIREVIGGDLALSVYEGMQENNLNGLSFNAIPANWMKIGLRPKEPIDFTGLKADKLIFMSNVDGVKVDGDTAMMITTGEIPALIKDGIVTDGMRVKMENCADALAAGVKRIHLINGLRENALRKEIFESVGPGTMILPENERENYMNEVEVQKAIEGK